MASFVKRFLFYYRNTYYSIVYCGILVSLILLRIAVSAVLHSGCSMHALALSKAASPAAKTPTLNHVTRYLMYIPTVSFYVMYHHLCTLYYVLKIVFQEKQRVRQVRQPFKPFHHKTTRPPICQSTPICGIPNHHLLASGGVFRPRRVQDQQRCLLCRSGMPGCADRTWGPVDQWRL